MSDITDITTPSTAENQTPDVAENNNTTNTLTGEVSKTSTEATTTAKEYPVGFDATTYNLETGQFNKEAIIKKFEDINNDKENFKKQALDLRKIVSKGKAPEGAEDYLKDLKPSEEFSKFYNFEEGQNEEIKERVDTLAKISKEQGLNTAQFNSIVNFMNETMTKHGVLDTRSQEEIEAESSNWMKAEMNKISEDVNTAREIIKSNVNFVKDFRSFNDDEKQALIDFMDKGAVAISAVNKFKTLFGGKGQDIPSIDVVDTGLASDDILATEYNKPSTSSARRLEIIKQRMAAGRNKPLPLIKK